jgi:hypothetical protein
MLDLELGAFSISLSVKDILVSKLFYEKIGFKEVGGDLSKKWLIMRNGDHTIGLFQGKFEKNILTFNPGWDKNGNKLETFFDIRDIQKRLREAGIEFDAEIDKNSKGPTSFVIIDPDGNSILFDQHV